MRGKTNNGWNWEWNSVYGKNTNKQFVENSNNASQKAIWGSQAPTQFYSGRVAFIQQTNTISFAKDLSKYFRNLSSFHIGFGAEYRYEKFYNRQGEEASWKNYDSTGSTQGGVPGSGSIDPANLVNEQRGIIGVYADLETDLNDQLLLNISGRYENYDDFGDNLTGKISFCYKFSPALMLRSSLSNSYHAPALQQIHASSTGSAWRNSVQVQLGHFRNNSDVAKAFGVKPLQPEKAITLGAGFTTKFSSRIYLTVDGYWIQLKNRIVLSGRFDKVTNPDVRRILERFTQVDLVQFMTNAINTRSRGLDIVMHSKWKIKEANLRILLAANFNQTKLFGPVQTSDSLAHNSQNTNTLFNREERIKIEKCQPASKIILTGNYSIGRMGILWRSTRFGKTSFAVGSDDTSRDEFFSAKILSDLSITYATRKWLQITAGVNNIFNVYPDPMKNYANTTEGILIYSNEASPFGFNGGYYFINLGFNF